MGTSWISTKGGILEKDWGGGYAPPYQLCYLSVYLPVNISYIVCKSILPTVIFEIAIWLFYTGKVITNIAYF